MDHLLVQSKPIVLHLSPLLFIAAARDHLDFIRTAPPFRDGATLPYFLCCRAIELALKAALLACGWDPDNDQPVRAPKVKRNPAVLQESSVRTWLRVTHGHNLVKAFDALEANAPALTVDERDLLERASGLYSAKRFEYPFPHDAVTAHTDFPDLDALVQLTQKLVNATASLL